MAIPITAKIRLARENSKNIPVIQKDLGSDIEGEANKDGTIFIDKQKAFNNYSNTFNPYFILS